MNAAEVKKLARKHFDDLRDKERMEIALGQRASAPPVLLASRVENVVFLEEMQRLACLWRVSRLQMAASIRSTRRRWRERRQERLLHLLTEEDAAQAVPPVPLSTAQEDRLVDLVLGANRRRRNPINRLLAWVGGRLARWLGGAALALRGDR